MNRMTIRCPFHVGDSGGRHTCTLDMNANAFACSACGRSGTLRVLADELEAQGRVIRFCVPEDGQNEVREHRWARDTDRRCACRSEKW
jgi:hypothetical protein